MADLDEKTPYPTNDVAEVAKIGDILVRKQMITEEQLEQALLEQTRNNKKLGQILVERQVLSLTQLQRALSDQQMTLQELVLHKKLVSQNQMDELLVPQATAPTSASTLSDQALGDILIERGWLTPDQLVDVLKECYWRRNGFWLIT
jgi:hypothetical protein